MSVPKSNCRKLGFEQLEIKTSPTGGLVDADWADAADAAGFHAQVQSADRFIRFIASFGSVSLARDLPSAAEVGIADNFLANEPIPIT